MENTDRLPKKGGLMRIGLYSQLARKHITNIKEEINKLGLGSSPDEMRTFRNMIINSDEDHHKEIRFSSDFYNMSSLKDLLFHVQEHKFTLSQIKIYLEKLGLKFCGFEKSQNTIKISAGKR